MKRLLVAVASLATVALSGCAGVAVLYPGSAGLYTSATAPRSYFSPTAPLSGAGADAHGESCTSSILGIITTGDSGYDAAYKAALASSGASSLYDVRVDTHVTNMLGLYATSCTELTGRVAK